MSVFDALVKKKKVEAVEEKTQKENPFAIAVEIMHISNSAKTKEKALDSLSEIFTKYDIENWSFISTLVLKYSIYNKKCVEYNEDIVKVFKMLDSIRFIKYFVIFCVENKVHYPPFLKYYSCGLMASNTKYNKFFEDLFEEHDLELLKLIMKKNLLSAKEVFQLYRSRKLKLPEEG